MLSFAALELIIIMSAIGLAQFYERTRDASVVDSLLTAACFGELSVVSTWLKRSGEFSTAATHRGT